MPASSQEVDAVVHYIDLSTPEFLRTLIGFIYATSSRFGNLWSTSSALNPCHYVIGLLGYEAKVVRLLTNSSKLSYTRAT